MTRVLRLSRLSPLLLLLAAALVALAVFLAPGGQPAQAQGDAIWSATMTVGNDPDSGRGYSALTAAGTPAGSLSGRNFTYDGVDQIVAALFVHSDGFLQLNLLFDVAANLKSDLTLHVGDRQFPLADAATIGTAGLRWSNAGLSWSLGDTIQLSLTTPPSSDASLSGLTASSAQSAGGTYSALGLTPTFSAFTTSYTATVANSVTHAKLTPTVNQGGATVGVRKGASGRFASVTSGSASAPIALDVGATRITVRVTAQDSTTRDYTVTVMRAYLSSTLTAGDLDYGDGCGYTSDQPTNCSAALTLGAFTYEGETYTVELVQVAFNGGTLRFILNKAPRDSNGARVRPSRLVLHVADREFRGKDALVSIGISDDRAYGGVNHDALSLSWIGTGMDWSDGQQVSLSLVILPVGGQSPQRESPPCANCAGAGDDGAIKRPELQEYQQQQQPQQQQQADPIPQNNAPTVAAPIADVREPVVGGSRQINLSGVFSDADGDTLTYSASSTDEDIAVGYVQSTELLVLALSRGAATITVTADDGGGAVSDSFTVTIKEAPTVARQIADIGGLEAGASRQVSLSGVFADADGDALTISAASSDTAVATVSVGAGQASLTARAVSAGTATITVTARDADGNMVSDMFDVAVSAPPDPEPLPGLPEVVARYDANQDGVISLSEYLAAVSDLGKGTVTVNDLILIRQAWVDGGYQQ